MIRRLFLCALAVVVCGCATRPQPTPETVRRSANPRAIVEGRVVDPRGAPVAGVSVRGLPREKEVAWTAPSVTDDQGRFRVELVAPGQYGFVLSWKGITIVTPFEDDPSRVLLRLAPGERRSGIELLFRREEWEHAVLSP